MGEGRGVRIYAPEAAIVRYTFVQTNGGIKILIVFMEAPKPTWGVYFVREKVRLRHARHSHIYVSCSFSFDEYEYIRIWLWKKTLRGTPGNENSFPNIVSFGTLWAEAHSERKKQRRYRMYVFLNSQ